MKGKRKRTRQGKRRSKRALLDLRAIRASAMGVPKGQRQRREGAQGTRKRSSVWQLLDLWREPLSVRVPQRKRERDEGVWKR